MHKLQKGRTEGDHYHLGYTSSLLMLMIILSPAGALSVVPLEQSDWLSEPTRVFENIDGSGTQMAIQGNELYLVWSGAEGVMFAKSTDNGTSFSTPANLAIWSQDLSVGLDPAVTVHNNEVYVLYSSSHDIFLVRSQDGGDSFGEPLNISRTRIDSPYVVTDHVMSISGNNIYVAWTVSSGNWSEIYLSKSSDGGKTFGEPKNVSESPYQPSQLPRMASSGNEVYLAWYDIDEYYAVNHVSFASSSDGGLSFSRINNLSANNQPYSAYEHSVVTGSDGVYVTWRDEVPLNDGTSNSAAGIAFAKSTDSGRTFEIVRHVGYGAWPIVAVEGDNIYIAFGIQENGTDNVGFVASLDGGKTFSDSVVLSNHTWSLNPYDDRPFPRIASDGANVFVAWRHTAGAGEDSNHETFLAASYDEGRTFTKPLNISQGKQSADTAQEPVLLAAPVDKVFVLWEEYVGNGLDIMLSRGQIPGEYTKPYREGSYMTPVEPYNPVFVTIGVIAAAIAGGIGGAYYYMNKKRLR